ncbi:hypothetical protein DYB28_012732 [Aphanomyces astaci]|uniref:Uncharacterized protein n=1 Tax=Aphanomyces astaci TaxID=112090 RepID=A0A9X8DQR5_APHAT|nr:hypothetical protein DYB28_012732 [Aphanomyces astaci]
MPPRLQIHKVFVRGKTLTSYQFGQPIDITSESATVEVQFTHDKKVLLSADKLNDMAASGRTKHFVPLADGGPGGVHLTLHVTTASSTRSPDATSAPASTSMIQQLTAKLRGAPILALLKRSGLVHQWIAVGLAACIWVPAMLLLLAGDPPSATTQLQPKQQPFVQNGGRTLTLLQYVYHADAPFPDGHDHHEPEVPPVPDRYIRATKGDAAAALGRAWFMFECRRNK